MKIKGLSPQILLDRYNKRSYMKRYRLFTKLGYKQTAVNGRVVTLKLRKDGSN